MTGAEAGSASIFAALHKTFPGGDFRLDVRFEVAPGITVLFGPSGSGKTTILECLSGLLKPNAGRIEVAGQVWLDTQVGTCLPPQARKAGYVFQTPALFPHLSIEQNAGFGVRGLAAAERRKRVTEALEGFHIGHCARRRPQEISGGERQRAALARALVRGPLVLLLDEPLSALDSVTKSRIIGDLRRWNEAHRIPVLYVTHDREELLALGERVLAMEAGRITAEGAPYEVLHAPRAETLAALAGFENIFEARVAQVHAGAGTMTCALPAGVTLEAPLGRFQPGDRLKLALRAGDILLAAARPAGLSARNILPGRVLRLQRAGTMVLGEVEAGGGSETSVHGAIFRVHLTPAAVEELALTAGSAVWMIIKTHSLQLLN